MIAKRLSILPTLPKGGDKRLSLSKKEDKSNSSNTKTFVSTTNDNVQSKQKTSEFNNFRINRPGRFSMKNKGVPFHLIFSANEEIKQKNNQVRSRSLSALLFRKNKLQIQKTILDDHKSQNFDQLTESTEIMDIFNILPKKQNPHKQYHQMFNLESLLQIRKNQNIAADLIQQKMQLCVNENQQKNFNENNELKVKKQFVSIGISTDLEIGSDSYKQFLRFKISKKQKYDQLQNLFQFIQNLYKKQIKSFSERQQQIKKLYEQNMSTQRQERVAQIIEKTNEAQKDIKQYVKKTANQIQSLKDKLCLKNKSEINKLQQEINNLRKDISQANKKLEQNMELNNVFINQKLYSNYEGQNQVVLNKVGSKNKNQFGQICQKLSNMSKLVDKIQQKSILSFQQEEQQLYGNLEDIIQTFHSWKQYSTKKNQIIQGCIDQLLILPQMSMTIFGMNDAMIQEKQNLKKIGICLDLIPQLDNFNKLNIQKKVQLNIDNTFQSFLNKKCMNCCYLKSKMRYIYAKNQQVKPVIKILNSLLNVPTKQSL